MQSSLIQHIFLSTTAFTGGLVIAGGAAALLIGLNIVPRYAQITHTANHRKLYELSILFGTIWGTVMSVYPLSLTGGKFIYGLVGLCFGIYVGSWVIALTEVLDMIPITARRIGLKEGMTGIVAVTALGKALFSLLFFEYL